MAVLLFTVLNGLGVVFLLYVLVQFWKEERRPMKPAERNRVEAFPVKERHTVLVVTHPISNSARGGLSVVSRQARVAVSQNSTPERESANGAGEMTLKRFSTR
jgi:hypothetical protein